ncbi:acyltransferase [Micrococcales bacterium 31B]|nr:acyltransferase [Micrococcales bacterium 31B]
MSLPKATEPRNGARRLRSLPGPGTGHTFRPDIQGLRAFAVVAVLVYHFFPDALPGGFVGVDIFFGISGYLITSLLIAEAGTHGRIALTSFYARRIRRLLPAALATLAATVCASALLDGPLRLRDTIADAAWAAAYLANFRAAEATEGYFAVGDPSPLQHFWSLAVEEQFYLIWPVLVAMAFVRTRPGRVLAITLGVLVAGSLLASVLLTEAGSPHAYFSIFTRAWQLALGALGAAYVTFVKTELSRRAALVAQGLGLSLMVGSVFVLTGDMAFPGWIAAIPTLGVVLALVGGSGHRDTPLDRVSRRGPVRLVGDASYSLYLWHWPVLILGIAAFGRDGAGERAALLAISVLLGWGSYALIERPTLRGLARRTPRAVVTGGVLLTGALAWVALIGVHTVPQSSGVVAVDGTREATVTLVQEGRLKTFALSGSIVAPASAGVPANASTRLVDLSDDLSPVFRNGCYVVTLVVCPGGDPEGTTTIVLAGDSQVGHWWPAFDAAARSHGWKLYIVGKNGCPITRLPITMGDDSHDAWLECDLWRPEAERTVLSLDPDIIVYANNAAWYPSKAGLADVTDTEWVGGIAPVLDAFTERSQVLYLGQYPQLAQDPSVCLDEHVTDVAACATPLAQAAPARWERVNRELASRPHVYYADLGAVICPSGTCSPMSGRDFIYRDAEHMTNTFNLSLAPLAAQWVTLILNDRSPLAQAG